MLAIEATGKFLTGGRGGNRDRFLAFLTSYMAPEYQFGTVGAMSYANALWLHFRNGLAHGFAVCHGGFERNRGQHYFDLKQVMGRDSLSLNPFLFFDDFVNGFGRYLSDLRTQQPSGPLFDDFNTVFEQVFIQGQ